MLAWKVYCNPALTRVPDLQPVEARELVGFEQIGVIEDQALGVLIRQIALRELVLAGHDLADRLDDVRAVAGDWLPMGRRP